MAEPVVRCSTCTGACCHERVVSIHLTAADLERLRASGRDPAALTDPHPIPGTAYVAVMKMAPRAIHGAPIGCVLSRADGCAAYESRPEVCQRFNAGGCGDLYTPDPGKLALQAAGRRTLRLV